MRCFVVVMTVLISLSAAGCFTWQANNGSQAVDVNPLAYGSGAPVIQLSNAPGYMNGQPFDMRSK